MLDALSNAGACILVLDEVQKFPAWTDEVKRLWDEDTAAGRDVRAVVLGSAPLLIARGLTESMAGRFEITRLGHWRYTEMRQAFDFTLAHYLKLLEGAGMVCGLQKYAGQALRQRASSPKLQVYNTALMGALAVAEGWGFAQLRATPEQWGRLVENAVGAELLARRLTHSSTQPALPYWHEAGKEVDYVLPDADGLFALEVKSGRQRGKVSGLDAFRTVHPRARPLVVGTGGLPLQDWFGQP